MKSNELSIASIIFFVVAIMIFNFGEPPHGFFTLGMAIYWQLRAIDARIKESKDE